MSEIHALFIICFIAVLAPLLARLPALIRTPVVVLELVLGILIGLSGAGWVTSQGAIGFLGEFGLIFLFFQAGFEFNQDKIGVAPLRLGALAWLVSLGLTSVFVELLYIVGCCARLCSSRLCYQRHHSASSFLFSAKPATSTATLAVMSSARRR
jgi:Kef-type K+ transport system membrane component KefB